MTRFYRNPSKWGQVTFNDNTFEQLTDSKPGDTISFSGMDDLEDRTFKIVRRDFKRKKVWVQEVLK